MIEPSVIVTYALRSNADFPLPRSVEIDAIFFWEAGASRSFVEMFRMIYGPEAHCGKLLVLERTL